MTTRRTFLRTSTLAAMAAAGRSPHSALAPLLRTTPATVPPGELPRATDPQLKELAMRALDAAKSSGASYADVRFTITRWRVFNNATPTDMEQAAVGVRALAKGAWGFAANSSWSPDIIAQLGRQAAQQAQVQAWPGVAPIELVDHAPAAVGNWVTPIKRDPFTVPIEETTAWMSRMGRKGYMVFSLIFERQERTFVSTEGAYTTQTIYTSLCSGVPHKDLLPTIIFNAPKSPLVTPTGVGYEILDEILEQRPMTLGKTKPFDAPGQYDVVFDGAAMATIVDGTFGAALEYDRAVGYEANAGGTSYLAPPLQILGTQHASPLVSITADRTLPRGVATVGWDDEGVAPAPFPLVKDGVVVDYSSSREFVSELAPWYQKRGMPVRSNGCSASESALTVPLVYTPNLVLQPASQDTSLDALIAGIDDGFLIRGGRPIQMDMQQMSGRGSGVLLYAIKHGQRVGPPLRDAVFTFRSADLWKNLAALGGASTAMMIGVNTFKGQPNQSSMHSVQGVAAHFTKVQVNNADSA